jgi:hypothetical protein
MAFSRPPLGLGGGFFFEKIDGARQTPESLAE